MKRKPAKTSRKTSSAKKLSLKRKNNKIFKGGLGAGTLYAIVALLLVALGGSLMIGSITPITTSEEESYLRQIRQPVNIHPARTQLEQDNLQLFTFPGTTYTPTPAPTFPPQPHRNDQDGGRHDDDGDHDGDDGGDDGSTCFPAGTKILLADGKQKNIEDIKIGDKIISYDGQKQTESTVKELESPIRGHLYTLTFADGSTLRLTREHPLFTSTGWRSISPRETAAENPNLIVGKLSIGDRVLNHNNRFIEITSMEYLPGKVQTYNLKKVSVHNNFFADGKLAHNKGSDGGSDGDSDGNDGGDNVGSEAR
jgi:hypothetical protein